MKPAEPSVNKQVTILEEGLHHHHHHLLLGLPHVVASHQARTLQKVSKSAPLPGRNARDTCHHPLAQGRQERWTFGDEFD